MKDFGKPSKPATTEAAKHPQDFGLFGGSSSDEDDIFSSRDKPAVQAKKPAPAAPASSKAKVVLFADEDDDDDDLFNLSLPPQPKPLPQSASQRGFSRMDSSDGPLQAKPDADMDAAYLKQKATAAKNAVAVASKSPELSSSPEEKPVEKAPPKKIPSNVSMKTIKRGGGQKATSLFDDDDDDDDDDFFMYIRMCFYKAGG